MTHDVAEDVDIYSDLSSFNYADCIKQLESSNRKLLQQLENLKLELSESTKEKEKLESRCGALSKNISTLFKTAQAEINRKDKTITELRSEINNVLFRRNKMGGSWGCGRARVESDTSSSKQRERGDVPSSQPERTERKASSTVFKSERHVQDSSHTNRDNLDLDNCSKEEGIRRRNKLSSNRKRDVDECKRNKSKQLEQSGSESSRQYSKKNDLRIIAKERRHVEPYREAYGTRSRCKQQDAKGSSSDALSSSVKEQCTLEKSLDTQSTSKNQRLQATIAFSPDTTTERVNPLEAIALLDNNPSVDNEVMTPELSDLSISNKSQPPTKLANLLGSTSNIVMTEYSKRMLKRIQEASTAKVGEAVTSNPDNEECKSSLKRNSKNEPSSLLSSSQNEVHSEAIPKVFNSAQESGSVLENISHTTVEKGEIVSEAVNITNVETNKVVLPDKFIAITDNVNTSGFNVSIDLSISSSSNSEIGEMNLSKTNHDTTPSTSVELTVKKCLEKTIDQGHIFKDPSEKITNTSKTVLGPTEILNSNSVKMGDTTDFKSSTNSPSVVPNERVTEDGQTETVGKNIESVKAGETLNNPCTDSILYCTNSIEDILDLSEEKTKVANVNIELFSIESIDKLAVSPKKTACPSVVTREINVTMPPLANPSICLTDLKSSASSPKIGFQSEMSRESKSDNKLSKLKGVKEGLETAGRSNRSNVAKPYVANNWLKNNGTTENNPCKGSKLGGSSVLSTATVCKGGKLSENSLSSVASVCKGGKLSGSSSLSVPSVCKEGCILENNQTAESFTSKIVQVKKKSNKNGFQPLITPISNLWNKSVVKNEHEPLLKVEVPTENTTKNVVEEKKLLDKSVKPDETGPKLDMAQTLFGSPVKWADSDSTDFAPITFNKDPSIFDDSHSFSEGDRLSLKPTLSEQISDKKLSGHIEETSIGKLNFLPPENVERIVCENSKSLVFSSDPLLKSDRNSSNLKYQSARYEDSLLGQFDDTLQFVSALSKPKKTVSPIGTPEKVISEKLATENSQPFSSLSITREAGFKIVGLNEKPINILTPRKTPRIVSPKKSNALTSPNSEIKSCRISCLDDKAIESVCNLVSSIKDNHRETYLVISKKSKTVKNSSPKKLDINDGNISKNKSPTSNKTSPVKNSVNISNSNLNQSKIDKTPLKKFPQLKLSPKKKSSVKITKETNSGENYLRSNNTLLVPGSQNCIDNTCKGTKPLSPQKKIGRIQLIDSLPFIPKSSSCTKVKMSYELKKPSRMSKRKSASDCQRSPGNKLKSSNESDINIDKLENLIGKNLKENDHELPLQSNQEKIRKTPPADTKFQQTSFGETTITCETIDKETNINEVLTSDSLIKPLLNDANCISKAIEINTLEMRNKTPLIQNTENNAIVLSAESLQTHNEVKTVVPNKLNEHLEILPKNSLNSVKYKVSNTNGVSEKKKNCIVDKLSNVSFESLIDEEVNRISYVSEEEKCLQAAKSDCSRSYLQDLRNKTVIAREKSKSPTLNGKKRKLSHSSESTSSNHHFNKNHSGFREPKFYPTSNADYHFNKRFSREVNYLPFRQKLSRRYSCYRRREPSICRQSRSPKRYINTKTYYSRYKYNKYKRHLSPVESKLERDEKRNSYHSLELRRHTITKPNNRSWSSSQIETVSISPHRQNGYILPNSSSYDRFNGISCNNIIWKLIEIDDVPDQPLKKTSLDCSNTVSHVPTPSVSSSPSSSMMLSKIVVKKKSLNLSSSETKVDCFSSTSVRNNSFNECSTKGSPGLKIPPSTASSDQQSFKSKKTPVYSLFSGSRTSLNKEENVSRDISEKLRTSSEKFEKFSKESDLVETYFHKSNPTCGKSPSPKTAEPSVKQNTHTVTYRVPSFMNKTSGEELKTVSVSRVSEKYSGLFSPPLTVKGNDNKHFPKESKVANASFSSIDSSFSSSDTSFTSDESWAPKKRKKKK